MTKSVLHNNKLPGEISLLLSGQISRTNRELRNLLLDNGLLGSAFSRRLKTAERDLRYAMLMLPVKAAAKKEDDARLSSLCAASELLYAAANLHDGVTQPGLEAESKSGAVLRGDLLYALALLRLTDLLPKELLSRTFENLEKASLNIITDGSEESIFGSAREYKEYLQKRAYLTPLFTMLGAYLTGACEREVSAVEKCGTGLAAAYLFQRDRQSGKLKNISFNADKILSDVISESKSALEALADSPYRSSIVKIFDYYSEQIKGPYFRKAPEYSENMP